MKLIEAINQCAETTKSKGFRTNQHATQIALVATEVAEALECTTPSGNPVVDAFTKTLINNCNVFEAHRKATKGQPHIDESTVTDLPHLLEEKADQVIRVFSYVGGNGWGEQFVEALINKMQVNAGRPALHGKAF